MSKIIIKLVIAICVSCLTLIVNAQDTYRATQISLRLTNKNIYDSLFYANDWRIESYKKVQDWYKQKNMKYDLDPNWMSKMLKIGDQMPDIELGSVINNPFGVKRFSDFKGKIVILDFWNTSCASCIGNFPKIAKLQEQFKDRVQFILVNIGETEEEITRKMGKKISKLPAILSIVNARHLSPYFPHVSEPYHAWIDQRGIVRILGRHENTYAEKIQSLLEGKEIISLNNESRGCFTNCVNSVTLNYRHTNGNTRRF